MKILVNSILLLVLSIFFVGGCCCGDVAANAPLSSRAYLPKIYGSHMVIQRQKPIVFVGECEPEKAVIVSFGKNKPKKVLANNVGQWRAEFPAQEAGGPFCLTVANGEKELLRLEDIMVGEVWICSGQSNMSCPLWGAGKFWRSYKGDEEVARANHPNLRFFNNNRLTSRTELMTDTKGSGWQVCSPKNIASFSAVGYYFGRQLLEELDVPIGLIGSNWGGTRIEPWISNDRFNIFYQEALGREYNGDNKISNEEAVELWFKQFYGSDPKASEAAKKWSKKDFNSLEWQEMKLPANVNELNTNDGIVWFRREVEIPEAWAGKSLTLHLGAIDDCDETWFNGEKIGVTDTKVPQYWIKKREYTIPANVVKAGRAVIAIRLVDLFSEGGFLGKDEDLKLVLNGQNIIPLSGNWQYKVEFFADLQKLGERPYVGGGKAHGHPSTLYNAMISPWTVYPIRGAIWYQGESNASNAPLYLKLHKALIADWRKQWQDEDLAFLFVQLSAFASHTPAKRLPEDAWKSVPLGSDRGYSLLREAQTDTLVIPKTGMAVTIDVGDQSDIHPQRKAEVGYRLAKEATRVCYGSKEVTCGPLFKSAKIVGNKVYLYFCGIGGGLVARGTKAGGFVIAGSENKFFHGEAAIEGDSIVVWSKDVPKPTQVRYGWAPFPGDANMFNKEGFPMSPFRSVR